MPSRLFIYYNERKMEGSIDQDSGGALRDGMKSINTTGVCAESMWPYDVSTFKTEPSAECYKAAQSAHTLKYRRVRQTEAAMKHALHTEQQPVVFGFTVYSSFESEEVAKTGRMPTPEADDKPMGGHAVLCVGFDDAQQCFIVRNSWGAEWGMGGYFYMPYDFLLDADSASDFWIIETISHAPPSPEHSAYADAFPELPQYCSPTSMPGTAEGAASDPEVAAIKFSGSLATGDGDFAAGSTMKIEWETSGEVPAVRLQVCVNSWAGMMSSWETVVDSIGNTGSYSWAIPADAVADTRYWLRVANPDNTSVYADSTYFSVH